MLHSLDEPSHRNLVFVKIAANIKHAFRAALLATAAALGTSAKAPTETAAKTSEDPIS